MIGYLPELYPDELVYSWLSRYFVHSGHVMHSVVLRELFCKRSDNPSKEFLGNLNENAKKVIQEVISLQELILRHTNVPQYARFVPLAERKEALHRMKFDYCNPHLLFPILVREEADAFLRYCPACAQEDRDTYGETYWHRKHQLRGAKVCYKHGCLLEHSTVSAKSEQGFMLCTAEEYAVIDTPCYCDNPELLRYTRFISDAFDAPMDFERDIPISAVLYNAMARTDYIKHTGRSRHTQRFADDLQAYYESIGLSGIATMNQIQRTLLMGQTEFTTVCQIAFFLGMSVKELIAPELTPEQITAEQETHYTRNRTPVDWAEFDAETSKILEPLVQSIYDGTFRADGRPERVSERLIYRVLDLQGHRLENMPLCRGLIHNSRYTETYPEHWARRLVWAYNKLKTERKDKPIHWLDLRRISGVKERNLHKVIPLIHKHTDPKTANIIRKIIE
jgi:hypothetical protein